MKREGMEGSGGPALPTGHREGWTLLCCRTVPGVLMQWRWHQAITYQIPFIPLRITSQLRQQQRSHQCVWDGCGHSCFPPAENTGSSRDAAPRTHLQGCSSRDATARVQPFPASHGCIRASNIIQTSPQFQPRLQERKMPKSGSPIHALPAGCPECPYEAAQGTHPTHTAPASPHSSTAHGRGSSFSPEPPRAASAQEQKPLLISSSLMA